VSEGAIVWRCSDILHVMFIQKFASEHILKKKWLSFLSPSTPCFGEES
jgi:hypothetical protein